uniref:Uncharacterized protein n=1 Tax=Zea mays TaxID=4577 RepID=A0A804RBL8_MAIZE
MRQPPRARPRTNLAVGYPAREPAHQAPSPRQAPSPATRLPPRPRSPPQLSPHPAIPAAHAPLSTRPRSSPLFAWIGYRSQLSPWIARPRQPNLLPVSMEGASSPRDSRFPASAPQIHSPLSHNPHGLCPVSPPRLLRT